MHITKASILSWAKTHTKLIAGLGAGVVVGAAGAAVVSASIPAANGRIYACYTTNNTGILARVRIIDNSTQTCNTNETAINWNQQGPAGPTGPQGPAGSPGDATPLAFGFFDYNGTNYILSNDHNVTDIQRADPLGNGRAGACITVSIDPVNVQVTPWATNHTSPFADVKVNGTWLQWGATDPCVDYPGANVWVSSNGGGKFFTVYGQPEE